MPPQVSIITAIKEGNPTSFLSDLYESLLKEKETSWEWLPQWNGPAEDLPEEALEDPRVRAEANGRPLGVAVTRNRALARIQASFVRLLDADDALIPGSLAKQIRVFEENPQVIFVCGGEKDLDSGQITLPSLPEGFIEPEALERYWREHHSSAITYPSALWRRDALLFYGGWQALSGMEDVALFLAANLTEPGYCLHKAMFLRRAHRGQMTIDPDFVDERLLNKKIIHERLLAARRHLSKKIPDDWQRGPHDKNRSLAIKKGERFGYEYEKE